MRIFIILFLLLSSPAWAGDARVKEEPALTPFSASYSTTFKFGWFTLTIDAQRVLKQLDNNQWQLTFDAETNGASFNEKSIFELKDHQITPVEYHFKTGGLLKKTPLNIGFDAQKEQIQDHNKNVTYKDLWQNNIQDNITYIVQASLDLNQGKTRVDYPIFKSHRIKVYSFKVVGEEVIDTEIGQLNTLKVERVKDKKKRTVTAWFAKEHNFQLVRLNESKKGKTTYQIDITQLEESLP